MRLERQRRVEDLLDARLAVVLDGLADLARVRRGLLDDLVADLFLALLEQRVVLREIRVAEHVCRDERVLLQRVVAREVGAAGITREHDLEEARVPHPMLDELIDVADAERPMRHAHRKPVDRDFHHEARRHLFEVHGVVVEPVAPRELLEPLRVPAEARAHVRPPPAAMTAG